MDRVRTVLLSAKERWDAYDRRTRVFLIVGLSVVAVLAAIVYLTASRQSYALLFSNLSQEDAGRIVERLNEMNVEYQIDDGGSSIRVPDDRVHETRLTLAGEGLPNGGGVGFELFDSQRFGESDFSEQVQFRRALEGELGRTISHLAGVRSARVHLVLPERTLFTNDDHGASASVALHLNAGWRLRDEQVEGVAHLVASSVSGLTPDAVTVVDGDGRPLNSNASESDSNASSDSRRSEIESARQRAVQQLLDASLGRGVAVVRVSAEVELSSEEHLEESYDPEAIATRSFEITQEGGASARGEAQGVAGAASNLPGGVAVETQGGGGTNGRRTERRNYEVTKMVRRAVHPVGRVRRLTVAIVVDGHWEGQAPDREFTPRSEEELERIRALASTAAGILESRGDAVTVECVPFADSESPPDTATTGPFAQYEAFAPYALIAVVLLVLLIGVLVWWLRHRAKKKKEEANRALESGEVQELPTPTEIAAEELESEDAVATLAEYEELRAIALEVARRDPELAARVVRGWLAEGGSAPTADEDAEAEKEEAA